MNGLQDWAYEFQLKPTDTMGMLIGQWVVAQNLPHQIETRTDGLNLAITIILHFGFNL